MQINNIHTYIHTYVRTYVRTYIHTRKLCIFYHLIKLFASICKSGSRCTDSGWVYTSNPRVQGRVWRTSNPRVRFAFGTCSTTIIRLWNSFIPVHHLIFITNQLTDSIHVHIVILSRIACASSEKGYLSKSTIP